MIAAAPQSQMENPRGSWFSGNFWLFWSGVAVGVIFLLLLEVITLVCSHYLPDLVADVTSTSGVIASAVICGLIVACVALAILDRMRQPDRMFRGIYYAISSACVLAITSVVPAFGWDIELAWQNPVNRGGQEIASGQEPISVLDIISELKIITFKTKKGSEFVCIAGLVFLLPAATYSICTLNRVYHDLFNEYN